MTDRADAHIHLFASGYRGSGLDEPELYVSFAREHRIRQALVVAYEAEPWAAANNRYLAALVGRYPWLRPAAYVAPANPPTVETLDALRHQAFIGIGLYIFNHDDARALSAIDDHIWDWLSDHRWLISLNSRNEFLSPWRNILDRHPELRLVVAHLALPPKLSNPPTAPEASKTLEPLLSLAGYPRVCVKLSGFYALTEPAHVYPHEAAWPYVEAAAERFGVDRLLWGSDFPPSLEAVAFSQTFTLFRAMGFLDDQAMRDIEGGNLARLLAEAGKCP